MSLNSGSRFDETAKLLEIQKKRKALSKLMSEEGKADKKIDIDLELIDSTENIRTEIEENQGFEALVNSIDKVGLLQPLVVVPHDNKVKLLSGHRRLAAVRKLGWNNVPVFVKQIDYKKDFTLAQLIENVNREEVEAIDYADATSNLKSKGDYTNKEVSKILGIHEKTVTLVVKVAGFPDSVKKIARDNRLGITALCNLAKKKESNEENFCLRYLNNLIEERKLASKKEEKASQTEGKAKDQKKGVSELSIWLQKRNLNIPQKSLSRINTIGRKLASMSNEERRLITEIISEMNENGVLHSMIKN